MLAEKNSLLYEASKAFYELSEDEKIRQQCEARLDYERTHAHFYRAVEENKELDKMLKEKTLQLQKLSKKMQKNERQLQKSEKQLQDNERQIQQREVLIQQQAEALLKKEEENAVLKAQLEKITKEKDFDKKSDET